MGKWADFPFVGGAYTDSALPWAHQDTVNYLPVLAERGGTRGPDKLSKPPGARVFASVGTGPHRGARDVEGNAFVVSGTGLYEVHTDGNSRLLGTIPGTGPVSMTHNQITGGNQLVIGNGSSGYVYNTVTGAFVQITDEGFPGFGTVDYIGQVVIGVEPQRRFWFHSDFADALEYNTLDRYEAESSPDRLVGVVVSHADVLVFGERTIEQWNNSPTETRSFQRNDGMTIERGCASEHTIRRLDNTVYFLADNMTVCKIEGGSTPVPVSTRSMERAFENADPNKAFAFTWEDGGHAVYYITVGDKTWGWDVTQREWHRRESWGLTRWRFNTMFKWNGDWYAGDYTNGKLYKLDWSYALEGCERVDCRRRTGYIHNSGNRIIVRGVRMEVDSGLSESVCVETVVTSYTMVASDSNTAFVFLYPYSGGTAIPVDTHPPSVGRGGSWSPDANHYVAPHDAAPYFTLYRRTSTGLVKQAGPVFTSNKDIGWSAAWSADSSRLALGMRGSPTVSSNYPFVAVFARSGDAYSQVASIFDASVTALKRPNSLSYNATGTQLAMSINESPGLVLYSIAGDVYSKVASPGTIPTGTGSFCTFSGDYLAYCHTGLAADGPLTVYKVAGTTLTQVFQNTTDGSCPRCAWSSDGVYLAAVMSGEFGRNLLRVYSKSGDTLTLVHSEYITTDGTSSGASLGVAGMAFDVTHLLLAVTTGNKVIAYTIGTFARDASVDILLPATSSEPTEYGLATVVNSETVESESDGHAIQLKGSKDGGRTWTTPRVKSLGTTGDFTSKAEFLQWGQCRSLLLEFRDFSAYRGDVIAASAHVDSE